MAGAMPFLLALLVLGCAEPAPVAQVSGVAPGPFIDQLAWGASFVGDPPRLPTVAVQARLLEVEHRMDTAVVEPAEARAVAGADLYAGVCAVPPRVDEAALGRLLAADHALRELAVQALFADLAITGPPAGGGQAAGFAAIDGPVSKFVGEQQRAALPPFERLPPLDPELKHSLEAAERARTTALDAAIARWKEAIAGWDPAGSGAEASLRAALAELEPALEANLRARAETARALAAALPEADRPRVLLSRGFRAYLGAAPVSESWGFLFRRSRSRPAGGGGTPGSRPDDGGGEPPGAFPAGTGKPEDFPMGTGDPSQLPAVAPAEVPMSPDGPPPPPEFATTPGPVEGPAPTSGVEPPPEGAMQPPPPPVTDAGPPPPEPPPPDVNTGEVPPEGFNGVRPR